MTRPDFLGASVNFSAGNASSNAWRWPENLDLQQRAVTP